MTTAADNTVATTTTTTSSRDDFDRSFDYWSRGGRGGGDTTTVSASSSSGTASSSSSTATTTIEREDASLSSQWKQRRPSARTVTRFPAPHGGGGSSGTTPSVEETEQDGSWDINGAATRTIGSTGSGDDRQAFEYRVTAGAGDTHDDVPRSPPSSFDRRSSGNQMRLLLSRGAGGTAGAAAAAKTSTSRLSGGAVAGGESVEIEIHEQLSAVYDDVSPEPSCHVEGTIYALQHQHHRYLEQQAGSPFCLTLRDLLGQLDRVEPNPDVCQNVSDRVSRQGLHRHDQVLRVRMPPPSPGPASSDPRLKIASYCSSIRPVPLLVKSRVQVSQKYSRAGFKIRANPSNEYTLTSMVIILAVPPYVKGSSARMSLPGGTWSEMKRTICWSVDSLEPGQALEVQLQFESMGERWEREPKFPVLVRADCPRLFSSLEVRSDFSDGLSRVVSTMVSTSARVLHRKV